MPESGNLMTFSRDSESEPQKVKKIQEIRDLMTF